MPSFIASLSTALGGTEKCCQVPGRSVNRKSIICTLLSLMALRTSSAEVHLSDICLTSRLQRICGLASPRRRYPHHQPRSRAVQDARWQHSLTNNVFSLGSPLSSRAARASASSRLQCVASFLHLRLRLSVRRRKPFEQLRQRPHNHGLPAIAARNLARRFLAFAWCHSPFLARDCTCQTRTRRSVLTPFHVSTSPGASAADLKFLERLPQTRLGTSNRKAALES